MNKCKENIQKLHGVWFWSGNWPLLDSIYERDEQYEKSFQKIAGIHPQISVDFFEDGILTAYHCSEELERLGNFLKTKVREDPLFIKKSFALYQQKTQADIDAITAIMKKDFVHFNGKELADMFKEIREYFAYNGAMDHYSYFIEKFFISDLQVYLENRLKEVKKEQKLAEYIALLVTPAKPTRIYMERQAFFKIVDYIRLNKKLVRKIQEGQCRESIFNNDPDLKKQITEHLEKFNWLPVLVNNPPTILDELWEELNQIIRNQSAYSVESVRLGDNYDENISQKKKKLLEQLQPPERIKLLIEALEETAFIRTEDNAVMSQSSSLLIPLYNEISKRLGITYAELKELLPEEVVQYLETNKKIPKNLIKNRLTLTCYMVYNGKREVFVDKEARELKEIFETQQNVTEGATEFRGFVASSGKITGKAKVCNTSKDARDIEPGDILVAPATSADFVPAMRKAGAIVTELGGLTSHAAVVAREFKLPCLVGVENITKLLKNGDIVEVDANNGIIKKIIF